MRWRHRLKQWIAALRMAGVSRVPWWGLVRAVLSGPVPRHVWRARLRYGCFQCPLYSRPNGIHLCRSTHPDMMGIGCGCYLPFTALWANPHGKGCYGRDLDDSIGWPAYIDQRSWFVRILDFLRGK